MIGSCAGRSQEGTVKYSDSFTASGLREKTALLGNAREGGSVWERARHLPFWEATELVQGEIAELKRRDEANRAGKGRDQSAPDSPPGLAQGAPLPVGLVAGAGADLAPDMSVEKVRQRLQLARKSHSPAMVAYYEQLLVLKESRPAPQQRADQSYKAYKTLEGMVKAQTEETTTIQKDLDTKRDMLRQTMQQLAVQEQQYRDAATELHQVAKPQKTVFNLADIVAGDLSKWELTCGEDLFGLAEFVDVSGEDRQQAKKREQELKERFRETATALLGELKTKATPVPGDDVPDGTIEIDPEDFKAKAQRILDEAIAQGLHFSINEGLDIEALQVVVFFDYHWYLVECVALAVPREGGDPMPVELGRRESLEGAVEYDWKFGLDIHRGCGSGPEGPESA
ncbi:unnamed protein product [Prorocentrum cordatum]|uniref:Uncharacterized protein n=1 Tax=Prorocentrum cordatum TaxID=2364126 RepID=A0ABN9UQ09_9DINO|nr:unnamed protein product [Polarella glacialis]